MVTSPARPGTGMPAALFAAAFVASNWTALWATDGYTWHVCAAAAVLLFERITRGAAPSPWGWVRWGPSLRHFATVAAIATVVVLALVLAAVVVIRIGGIRFDMHPQNVRHPGAFWGWFWFAVVCAPIVEEWIYRGLIQPRLREFLSARWAILVSGLLFWIYHWIAHGGVTAPNHLLAGWLFAWSWQRTGSLVAPTLLHALGNLALGLGDMLYLTRRELVASVLGW